jgi:hypothetical protein
MKKDWRYPMMIKFKNVGTDDKKPTITISELRKSFPKFPSIKKDVVVDILFITRNGQKLSYRFKSSRPNKKGRAQTLYGFEDWFTSIPFPKYKEFIEYNVYDFQVNPKTLPLDKCPIKEVEACKPFESVIDRVAKDEEFNPRYSNDHEIGIVLGGYLDSNHRLIDRSELNRRIKAKDKEIEDLKKVVLKQNDEGAKMSAENVWFTKFHDIVKEEDISPSRYKEITNFMFSEHDR